MKSSLDPNRMDLQMMYQLDNITSVIRPLSCPIIRVDEYQMAIIPCRTHDYSELHVIDFIQLDQQTDDYDSWNTKESEILVFRDIFIMTIKWFESISLSYSNSQCNALNDLGKNSIKHIFIWQKNCINLWTLRFLREKTFQDRVNCYS